MENEFGVKIPESINFVINNKEIIRIEENGNFYYKDKLVTNDMEIYEIIKIFFYNVYNKM